MAASVNDTIVVCAPKQVKEAAVVLSCFCNDSFTPLIVLEPPPATEEHYRKLYEDYRIVRDQRDSVLGGQLGRADALAGKAQFVSTEEVDRKLEPLTPYRSWWRHNRLIAAILAGLPLRRAIFLSEFPVNELYLIDPIPNRQIGKKREPTVPDTLEWIYILPASQAGSSNTDRLQYCYQSLFELTDVAYRVVRNADVTAATVEIPNSEAIHFLAGLQRALQVGVPLRPLDGKESAVAPICAKSAKPLTAPQEAVLVEVSNDATSLLGVLYAHQRQAKLILYPEPDISAVKQAQLEMDGQHKEASKSLSYLVTHHARGLNLPDLSPEESSWLNTLTRLQSPKLSPGETPGYEPTKFLSAVRNFFSDWSTVAIRHLHEAVSVLVPDRVVSEVGLLNLTVFTAGMPYNFVKTTHADWSTKPIGHITGDPSLLILTELCEGDGSNGTGFNLIFDPGYFPATGETTGVLHELEKRVSISLVLHDYASSHLSLAHLAKTLPLEVLFFNTHGSDDAILLKDMRLPAYKVVQRVHLDSRPIVFNNSCLSWIGVGRQFVRAGARGYIGTLWSVDAELAASYARTVLNRMIHDGLPACQAMRQTGIDLATEKAYIFVGTCNVMLAPPLAADSTAEQKRISFAAGALLESLLEFSREGEGSTSPFLTSVQDILFDRAEELIRYQKQHWPAPNLDRLDVLLLYLRVLPNLIPRRRDYVEEKAKFIKETLDLLNALNLDDKTRLNRLARYLHFSGRLHFRLGKIDSAVTLLRASVETAAKAGDPVGPQSLELSDAYKLGGQLGNALQAAQRASESYETDGRNLFPEMGRILALGRLTSIANWLHKYDRALLYAKKGVDLATKSDSTGEQSEFKADEARASLGLGNYDAALTAAMESLTFARLAYNDARELSATGIAVQALIGKGELNAALEKATTGLRQALNRDFDSEAGAFLCDIGKIKSLMEEPEADLEAFLNAVSTYATAGLIPKVVFALDSARKERDIIKTPAAIFEMVSLQLAVMNILDPGLRPILTTDVIESLKQAISYAGFPPVRQGLQRLVQEAANDLRTPGDQPPRQLTFILRFIVAMEDWAAGRQTKALQAAKSLDELSGGGFQIVKFLEGSGAVSPTDDKVNPASPQGPIPGAAS